jgi:hypothetical protein
MVIEKESNPDVRERRVSNRLCPRAIKKDFEDKFSVDRKIV